MSDLDRLTGARRAVVHVAHQAILFSELTGAEMKLGYATPEAYDDAQTRATQALGDAEAAGVPLSLRALQRRLGHASLPSPCSI